MSIKQGGKRLPTAAGAGSAEEKEGLSRRQFVQFAAGSFIASLGLTAGCSPDAVEEALQDHFTRLSPDELKGVMARMEKSYSKQFETKVSVTAPPAQDNVLFGYALDIGKCIGCRRCVYACVEENNQSRDPRVEWIKVYEMDKGRWLQFDENADPYYDRETVPQADKFYLPVACQQCEDPPCVNVCPTEATWKEPDGIVVIDYNWCIGCRYCMAACPYEARRFNWHEPSLPKEQLNADTHYLGNRPRGKGVVEKCTFCIQRTRNGRYPACVEVCPAGARKFGNLLDPKSEVRQVLKYKHVFVLKSELNTNPKFYYYYGVEPRE